MAAKLQWKNLRDNRCPKCGNKLFSSVTGMHSCQTTDCDFKITDKKLSEIKYNHDNNIRPDGRRQFEEGYGN